MAIFDNALSYAKDIVDQEIQSTDVCLDMTLGNGNDAIYMATRCKQVFAFDINPDAIKIAQTNLKDAGVVNVNCIHDSHHKVRNYINYPIGIAMFNLGYFPGGDKSEHTDYHTTIQSLQEILPMLRVQGTIVVVLYPGSVKGYEESLYVEDFLTTLPQKEYDVIKYHPLNQIHFPPYVIAIRKKRVV